jgi:hypothetical protein
MFVTLDIWFLIALGLFLVFLGAALGISVARSLKS